MNTALVNWDSMYCKCGLRCSYYLRKESYILAVMLLLSRLYAPPIDVKNSDAWYSAYI